MKQFEEISFNHIIRENNQLADALATLPSVFALSEDEDMPHIKIQCCGLPTYCQLVEEESDGKPWHYDIKKYIKSWEYPPSALENDKRTLRRLAMSFFFNGDVLYERNHVTQMCRYNWSTKIYQRSSLRLIWQCRNLPFGGRVTRGLTGASSKKGIRAESPPMLIWGKRRKRRGLRTLSERFGSCIYARERY